MNVLAAHAPLAVDLNAPGGYLNWSIFTISEANLVLVAVMVAIFGIALLAPFPGRRHGAITAAPEPADPAESADAPDLAGAAAMGDEADARMWTARTRRWALRVLPPQKLLPDRQPAYVASWVYVFGVAALAALGMAIVSGFAIALGGTDWWHTNPVGHFFNSVHLWSVELFMAFLVIHLWGKFWMAAWRGRRALTWITGVVAFVAAIMECFTGYLSQQNLDSQWIATNGKDAFNATGIGAFFNLMNFGQMLLWHVVLIAVMVAIFGIALLAPFPGRRHGAGTTAEPEPAAAQEAGGTEDLVGAAAMGDEADARMWTARTRRWALRVLPPQKLLPDRQPAYVAS
ncbi:cytochrome b N-terminal domain-containing protein, partial [Trebonia sp.]|uniref:cytochrome b N-terminal domain-containing protein n=1 Tax=Trebonia sp. TaxID=2767075 RepID=UPI003BAFF005